ncbi:MAG: leucine-rich repeat protein [Lachnospiraceae bacterium]|nr:leucine-rich repeat protein [Lachnospiraceae bacterium]MDD3617338.1 leucine-rich repeat protein [Lachnospiraceae bacterium]
MIKKVIALCVSVSLLISMQGMTILAEQLTSRNMQETDAQEIDTQEIDKQTALDDPGMEEASEEENSVTDETTGDQFTADGEASLDENTEAEDGEDKNQDNKDAEAEIDIENTDPEENAVEETGEIETASSDFNIQNGVLIEYTGTASSVTVPNTVKSIGALAFLQKNTVKEITLPDSVTRLEDHAFHVCGNLEKINMSKNIVYIGYGAFYQCMNLKTITIPQKTSVIGEAAFHKCQSLTKIEVVEENQFFASENGVLFNKNKTTLLCYPGGKTNENYSLPDSVERIESFAFSFAYYVKNIQGGENLAGIESSAFFKSAVESIVLLERVVYIGEDAFYMSTNFKTIYGYEGTYAEQYAKEHPEYEFVMLSKSERAYVKAHLSFMQSSKYRALISQESGGMAGRRKRAYEEAGNAVANGVFDFINGIGYCFSGDFKQLNLNEYDILLEQMLLNQTLGNEFEATVGEKSLDVLDTIITDISKYYTAKNLVKPQNFSRIEQAVKSTDIFDPDFLLNWDNYISVVETDINASNMKSILGAAGFIIDVTDKSLSSVRDVLEYVVLGEAYSMAQEEFTSVLLACRNWAYSDNDANASRLVKAIDKFLSSYNAYKTDQLTAIRTKVVNTATVFENELASKVIMEVVTEVAQKNAVVLGITIGLDMGIYLSDKLLCIDDVAYNGRMLMRTGYFAEILNTVMGNYGSKLTKNKEYSSAKLFDMSYKMYMKIQSMSCDFEKEYKVAVYNNPSAQSQISYIWNAPELDAYILELARDKSVYLNSKCHDEAVEQIADSKIDYNNSTFYAVACPVTVQVWNENNTLVATLDGSSNTVKEEYKHYFFGGVGTDARKVVILPNDKYRIKITGNSAGSMSAYINKTVNGNTQTENYFMNVPVAKNTVYTFGENGTDATLTGTASNGKKTTYESRPAIPFVDVRVGDWYYNPVNYSFLNKIILGMDATHFSPASTLSRAQFATILYRMSGSPSVSYEPMFKDVTQGNFYTESAVWAGKNGVVKGYDNGNFGPADNITREQMAIILYRYAKQCGYSVSNQANISGFNDVSAISSYAVSALRWANYIGVITGKDNGTRIDPRGNASRADCSSIIMRYCGWTDSQIVKDTHATGVTLNKSSASLYVGQTQALSASITPSDAIDGITWSSSNTTVATVNQSGTVSALKAGTCTVKARTDNGIEASCTITVTQPSISFTNVSSSISCTIDDTKILYVSTNPYTSSVQWTSSNSSVATVSQGKITAVGAGSCTITAKVTLYNKSYSTSVTVNVKKYAISYKTYFQETMTESLPDACNVVYRFPAADNYQLVWGSNYDTSSVKLYNTYRMDTTFWNSAQADYDSGIIIRAIAKMEAFDYDGEYGPCIQNDYEKYIAKASIAIKNARAGEFKSDFPAINDSFLEAEDYLRSAINTLCTYEEQNNSSLKYNTHWIEFKNAISSTQLKGAAASKNCYSILDKYFE